MPKYSLIAHLKTLQPGSPDSNAPYLTNLLLDEAINAPAADATSTADANSSPGMPVIVVSPLFVPLIHEVVVIARASATSAAASSPDTAAPHELRAAHLGLETEAGAPTGG